MTVFLAFISSKFVLASTRRQVHASARVTTAAGAHVSPLAVVVMYVGDRLSHARYLPHGLGVCLTRQEQRLLKEAVVQWPLSGVNSMSGASGWALPPSFQTPVNLSTSFMLFTAPLLPPGLKAGAN